MHAASILRRTRLRRLHGFTLLEVLVVLLIVGVILTFAGLSINVGVDRQLETEAQRLYALMDMASEEAVLTGRPRFLQLFPDGYRFVEPGKDDKWVVIEDDRQLRPRELPPGMQLEATLDGVEATFSEKEEPPVIGFFASGELAPPFELALRTEEFGSYALQGSEDGRFSFTHKTAEEEAQ
jgi:general secretion pathway protein H